MTEDDTFEALRRTPFPAMVRLVCENTSMGPEKMIKMWSNCYHDSVAWHGPAEEWVQIYKGHGWTFDELIEEASKHVD